MTNKSADLDEYKICSTDESVPELVSREGLKAIGIRYSNAHLLVLESEKRFPKRLYLSPAKVAWMRNEIVAWKLDTFCQITPGTRLIYISVPMPSRSR